MMGQTWKTHIIILIAVTVPELLLCSPLDETDSLNYPVDYVYTGDGVNDQLEKRLSSFVRIGRGLSSFIRIGKNGPGFGEYESETSDGDDDEGEFQKRKSAFVRIGRGDEPDADKRLSSFVRIGRSGDDTEPYFSPLEKRGGAFIRLGKFPSAAFVRNRSGKIHSIASPPYYRRSGRIGHSSFIRIGKRDTRDALKQASEHEINEDQLEDYLKNKQDIETLNSVTEPLKDVRNEQEKRLSSFVRIGRPGNGYIPNDLYRKALYDQTWPAAAAKRMSKFVRIGKDTDGDDMYKRMSSFVRIGKGYGTLDDMDKRMSKFVRIGKAAEVPNEDFNAQKRRLSKFVRIGKDLATLSNSLDQNEQQPDKRMSSFVRIGKSDDDKRMSSFVRIGKSNDAKRKSSFVRIGKASATNSADALQTYSTDDLASDDLGIKSE